MLGNADVYRSGVRVSGPGGATSPADDDIGQKGGGSYPYQFCPVGILPGSTECSDIAWVDF